MAGSDGVGVYQAGGGRLKNGFPVMCGFRYFQTAFHPPPYGRNDRPIFAISLRGIRCFGKNQ
ncbi:hypothetical protein NEIELOOT_01037 [Neisseria elongata subsp. glycolytica ATCC 29315]|uniref:Uncharacterized protein n=1 Tax=Neisseria elongata subsp. glycolytica ATCC 29315 TaxID=546263 RepID=D4DPQ0_NEIEG|nr:hypothetical protein NEIELOOT_01037 [Neisseria elongata subsp. glycolytica ATCC 29315]